jgi:hypothetical protein
MSKFGQTLFGDGGFIRWTLSPFVLLFAFTMPMLINGWTFGRMVLIGGMELMCACLLAGFWLPPRIGFWGFRVLAGLVFVAYAAYLIDEFLFSQKPSNGIGRRSDASPFNALLGLLVIGVPCLLFAVLGRFTLRPPPETGGGESDESNGDA